MHIFTTVENVIQFGKMGINFSLKVHGFNPQSENSLKPKKKTTA